jgi:penicillin-binding protein 1B
MEKTGWLAGAGRVVGSGLSALRLRSFSLSRATLTRRGIPVLVSVPILLLGMEALVRARLHDDSDWRSTTRIYARPPVLTRGMRPDKAGMEAYLGRLGYQRARGNEVGIGEYYLGSWGWIVGHRPFRYLEDLRDPGFVVARFDYSGRITRLEDEEGRRLSRAALEPELIGHFAGRSLEDRLPVALTEVPEHLVQALLTVEDQRFYQHSGLDFRRIGAAFAANFKAGRVVQGGSTLTQQLAKNLFLSPRRSVFRKLREAAMAMVLETRHTKDEILQAYLNQVYLGQAGAVGIHGVGRAAEHFFGTDVSSLTLDESALLVALIRAPSLYSPFRHPETAVTRRNLVLRLIAEAGVVGEEEAREAAEVPLRLRRPSAPIKSARYFTDFLRDGLDRTDHLSAVVTTLDARLQRAAETAVREGIVRLERDFDWLRTEGDGEPLQAALVALDPRTGEILAMVGGRDYGTSQFNRAVNARRQPGSAFKPVVALTALARQQQAGPELQPPAFTLASLVQDAPLRVETPAGLWEPANYDREYGGAVTLREALERSLNVPFARLGLEVGPERIVETARKMGIDSPLNPFPSLALGAAEVSPLEMARAFGVLAAEGYRADLKSTLHSVESDGHSGPGGNRLADANGHSGHEGWEDRSAGEGSPQGGGRQVFDPAETFLVTSALRGAVERGTGRGLRDRGFLGDVAAKSGTTNDYRDGWFVGYTPSLVVAVWVGFDHGKRLELPGAGVALPIFADFHEEAVGSGGGQGLRGGTEFEYPSGLERVDVDPATGLRGGWGCRGEPELFLLGTAPEVSCRGVRVRGLRFGELLEEGGEEVLRLLRRILMGDEPRSEGTRGRGSIGWRDRR